MRLVALFGSLLPFVSGGSYDAAPLSSGGGGAPLLNANASAWTVTAGGAGATFVVRAPLPTAPPSRPTDAPSNVTYPFSTLAEKPNDPTRDLSWSILGLPPQECCDDLDCGNPLLPHWPGNCAEKIQCGAPCPAEPIDAYTPLIKNVRPRGRAARLPAGLRALLMRALGSPARLPAGLRALLCARLAPRLTPPLPPFAGLWKRRHLQKPRAAGPDLRLQLQMRLQIPERAHTVGVRLKPVGDSACGPRGPERGRAARAGGRILPQWGKRFPIFLPPPLLRTALASGPRRPPTPPRAPPPPRAGCPRG